MRGGSANLRETQRSTAEYRPLAHFFFVEEKRRFAACINSSVDSSSLLLTPLRRLLSDASWLYALRHFSKRETQILFVIIQSLCIINAKNETKCQLYADEYSVSTENWSTGVGGALSSLNKN